MNGYQEVIIKFLQKMSVLSFNGSGIAASNIDEFYKYCCKEFYRTLKHPDQYNIYIIVNERVMNADSKVEHYKKCWKKVASKFDVSQFELGQEVGYEYGGHFFYAGIAKTSITNLVDILRIVNAKPNKCVLLASKNNYFEKSYIYDSFIKSYIDYDQYGNIDYSKCLGQCSLNHDLGLRYGTSFSEAELALIFSRYDADELWIRDGGE